MNVPKSQIIAIGDELKDIVAAKRAEIYSVAAIWGATDKDGLISLNPEYVLKTVNDLKDFLYIKYQLN